MISTICLVLTVLQLNSLIPEKMHTHKGPSGSVNWPQNHKLTLSGAQGSSSNIIKNRLVLLKGVSGD